MGRDTSFVVINNRDTTHSIARLAISDFGSLSKELIIYYDFVRRYVDKYESGKSQLLVVKYVVVVIVRGIQ